MGAAKISATKHVAASKIEMCKNEEVRGSEVSTSKIEDLTEAISAAEKEIEGTTNWNICEEEATDSAKAQAESTIGHFVQRENRKGPNKGPKHVKIFCSARDKTPAQKKAARQAATEAAVSRKRNLKAMKTTKKTKKTMKEAAAPADAMLVFTKSVAKAAKSSSSPAQHPSLSLVEFNQGACTDALRFALQTGASSDVVADLRARCARKWKRRQKKKEEAARQPKRVTKKLEKEVEEDERGAFGPSHAFEKEASAVAHLYFPR